MKDSITRFLENDMELNGRIDGEDDEETSDGETGGIDKEMVRKTHPHSLLFSYMLFLLKSVYLWCLQSCISPEYGHSSPLTIGNFMIN